MAALSCTLTVTRMPEALAAMRAEIARLVREVALDEDPRVAARLRELADAFECGQAPGGDDAD